MADDGIGDADNRVMADDAATSSAHDGDRQTYGVFAPSARATVPRSIATGVFVGGAWASAGLIIACLAAVCSGNDFVTARWAMSIVIAFVAYGVLQQVSFNCNKTDGWSYVRSVITFGIAFYVVLTLCALIGKWLPVGSVNAWMLFTAIYAMILVLFAFAFKASDDDPDDDTDGEK